MPIVKKQRHNAIAAPKKIISSPGFIWQLGQHRLMCGDSTDVTQVKQLMVNEDEKADLAFTDPPYNVRYVGSKKERKPLANDFLTREQYTEFLQRLIASHKAVLKRGASFYLCYASSNHRECQAALESNDFIIRNQIVWAKNHFVVSAARYKSKHEMIFYCHLKDERDPWYGGTKQTTVWEIPKHSANRWHPTMKPLALIEKALTNSSKTDDVILDLCGGAGSTLIVCEKLKRVARLIEIEPCYVDATIQRWQDLTDQEAILLQSNLSFNELLKQQNTQ